MIEIMAGVVLGFVAFFASGLALSFAIGLWEKIPAAASAMTARAEGLAQAVSPSPMRSRASNP